MKICKVEKCDSKHVAKGYCKFHYNRSVAGIPLDQIKQGTNKICLMVLVIGNIRQKGTVIYIIKDIEKDSP